VRAHRLDPRMTRVDPRMTSLDRRGPSCFFRTTGRFRVIASGPPGTTAFISRSRHVHRGMTAFVSRSRHVDSGMTALPRLITTGPRETNALLRGTKGVHPRMTCGPREITRLLRASTWRPRGLGPSIRNLQPTMSGSTGFLRLSSGRLIGIERPLRGSKRLVQGIGRVVPA